MPLGEQTRPEYDEKKDQPPPPPPPPPLVIPTRNEFGIKTDPYHGGFEREANMQMYASSDPVSEMLASLLAPLAEGTYSITGHFGDTEGVYPDSGHIGVDFGTGGKSVPIYAPLRGAVIENGWNPGYGWYIKIQHPDGTVTLYAHMADQSPIKAGTPVGDREQIGMTGSTGHSTGIHLHFEVYDPDGNRYDPMAWLNGEAPGDYNTTPTSKYAFKPSSRPVKETDTQTISFQDGQLFRRYPGATRGEQTYNPYASMFSNLFGGLGMNDPVQDVLSSMGIQGDGYGTADPVTAVLQDLGVL